jgi:hypothetical protein
VPPLGIRSHKVQIMTNDSEKQASERIKAVEIAWQGGILSGGFVDS